MKNTFQLLTDTINHLQKLADDLGDLNKFKDAAQPEQDEQKEQHGQTWDAAIKAHDDRGHVHSRSWCDFDEYWQEFKKTKGAP